MQKLNSKKSYSEMYEILNILGEEFINRIPKKMYELIDEERDIEYKPNLLKEDGLLDESKISQETIALFAVLNVKYFMDDENEKQEFLNTLKENDEKYQAELREKYNLDNIFKDTKTQKNKENSNIKDINLPDKVKKDSIINRIIQFIKKMCKR